MKYVFKIVIYVLLLQTWILIKVNQREFRSISRKIVVIRDQWIKIYNRRIAILQNIDDLVEISDDLHRELDKL